MNLSVTVLIQTIGDARENAWLANAVNEAVEYGEMMSTILAGELEKISATRYTNINQV